MITTATNQNRMSLIFALASRLRNFIATLRSDSLMWSVRSIMFPLVFAIFRANTWLKSREKCSRPQASYLRLRLERPWLAFRRPSGVIAVPLRSTPANSPLLRE